MATTRPDVQHLLNGSIQTVYGAPMRPGDVITSTYTLADYSERPSRLGLMLFATTDDVRTNRHGQLVRKSRGGFIRY